MNSAKLSAWFYVLIAALGQSLWGITLKKCEFGKVGKALIQLDIFNIRFLELLVPILLYLVLGFVIVVFVSKAYKLLPMSIVYAFWMGLTILFQVGIDLFYFKEQFSAIQLFFVGVILVGIIGMKTATKSPGNNWIDTVKTIEEDIENED